MRMKALGFLAAVLLVIAVCALGETPVPSAAPETPVETAGGTAADESTVTDLAAEPAATPKPARGYVLVSTSTGYGFLPLPEDEDYTYPLVQTKTDGSQTVNYIHVTPHGVYMEDSTCEGHDCVEQGAVTLENREERILGNMIICLPNQVILELYTPEELLALMNGGTEEGK